MTDRKGSRGGGGKRHTGRRPAKRGLAVWIALLALLIPAGCGAGEEPGQEQLNPERIGSVAHRDKTEEEGWEEPADDAAAGDEAGHAENVQSASSEDSTATGQEDALHLGQIAASEEEEGEKVTELTFRIVGEAEGIPQEAVDQIARINQGEQLWVVIGSDYLKDYYALTGTHTVEAQGRDSGQKAVGAGRLTMYVPNLLEGLSDIAVLFYDDTAGRWCLIPAEKVDMEKRTVSMILTGSGTLTVIHRTQGETKE